MFSFCRCEVRCNNDLMSFGVHRLWKRITIDMSGARPGNQILDLAGGTGDLT